MDRFEKVEKTFAESLGELGELVSDTRRMSVEGIRNLQTKNDELSILQNHLADSGIETTRALERNIKATEERLMAHLGGIPAGGNGGGGDNAGSAELQKIKDMQTGFESSLAKSQATQNQLVATQQDLMAEIRKIS